MNVNEFDIKVRNLLQNAEEPVSPAVWKGVAAGLDAKAPRVVPLWLWWSSALAVAAAAAVVLGVFLFRPAGLETVPDQGLVAQVQSSATAGGLALAAPAVVSVGSVETSGSQDLRSAHSAPVEAVQDAGIVPQVLLQKSASRLAMPPKGSYAPRVEDHALLNQLAVTEEEKPSGKGLSLMAGGNIQSNSRGSLSEVPGRRAFGVQQNPTGEYIDNLGPDSFSLPFSVGVSAKYNFSPRWAVGLGVRYTNLSRSFVADYHSGEGWGIDNTEIDNHQHWAGVSLNAYYDIVNRGRWRVHTFAGGAVEYLLSNEFLVHNPNNQNDINYKEPGTHFQWSAGAGLGVEYRLTPHVGLFLDPSIRYYFDHANKPRSLRTIQPLRFDIEAGLRFSFGQF